MPGSVDHPNAYLAELYTTQAKKISLTVTDKLATRKAKKHFKLNAHQYQEQALGDAESEGVHINGWSETTEE